MVKHPGRLAIVGLFSAILVSLPAAVLAEGTQTIFYVATNGNTGRANYDIRLNSDCSPTNANPVYSYWRKADGSTRSLNPLEQEGYGVTNQTVTGKQVQFVINAFQDHGIDKPITVISAQSTNGTCQAEAFTNINGVATPIAYAQVEVDRTQIAGLTVGLEVLNITIVGTNQQSETIACNSNCSYGL